jgi:hypothetical protein
MNKIWKNIALNILQEALLLVGVIMLIFEIKANKWRGFVAWAWSLKK